MTFEWEDPPPDPHQSYVPEFITQVREHPGKWAVVRRDFTKAGCRTAQGRLRSFGCETRMHIDNATGRFTLYGRWPEDG